MSPYSRCFRPLSDEIAKAGRPLPTRRGSAAWLRGLALVGGLFLCGGASDRSWAAVEAETTQEKASRLHQQAQPDMFRQWSFDRDQVHAPPSGFRAYDRGGAPASSWEVKPDTAALSGASVVAVGAQCEGACLHMLVVDALRYEYPDLSVRVRVPDGGGRRVAGLVFGWQDAQNFYVALADLEAAVVELSKVVGGQETLMGRAPVAVKTSSPWHVLRAARNTIISRDFIEVSFDGRQAVSVQDQSLGTGLVGLAARGVGELQFDNFHAAPLFSQRPLSSPGAY